MRLCKLPELPHFAPKAKLAIYLFMAGAPSQMDLFDYKPYLADWFNKDLPESVRLGQRLTTVPCPELLTIAPTSKPPSTNPYKNQDST